jgi:opacity protein-like surface antigen
MGEHLQSFCSLGRNKWDNSLMFNALFDFEMGGPIVPYIGGGLGATQIQWGNNFPGSDAGDSNDL